MSGNIAKCPSQVPKELGEIFKMLILSDQQSEPISPFKITKEIEGDGASQGLRYLLHKLHTLIMTFCCFLVSFCNILHKISALMDMTYSCLEVMLGGRALAHECLLVAEARGSR